MTRLSNNRVNSSYANNTVSVLDFGADPTGVSDSTAGIQAALDSGAKEIVIPEGSYLLDASLTLSSNTVITINGTLKRDTGVAAFDMLVGDSVDNVTIKGSGVIDGVTLLDQAVAANRFCGIRFYDSSAVSPCTNIVVDGIEVKNTTSAEVQAEGNRGAIILEDTVNGTVRNCYVHTNRATSVMIQGSANADCKVINNTLCNNDTIGSGVSGNSYTGLIVQGNTVYNTKYTAISVNGKKSVVNGNTVYGAPDNYAGITLGHNSAASNASGTVCSNNVIRDCGTTTAFVGGIVITNSDDVIISNNSVKDNTGVGIKFLDDVTDATGGCKVLGNVIEGNGANAILIEWGVDHDISNNTIRNNAGSGVYVNGATDYGIDEVYIRNNLIKDNGTTVNQSGVTTVPPSVGTMTVKVHGNIFEGDGSLIQANGIWASGANTVVEVKDNDFNSTYTEALAYRKTTGGTFVFKHAKGEDVTLVTSLDNGWSAVSSLGYWKDDNGVVHIQGAANGGTVSTSAFTLPVGYRPSETQNFVSVANNAFAITSVQSGGNVVLYTSNVNHYLSGISFKADTSADAS